MSAGPGFCATLLRLRGVWGFDTIPCMNRQHSGHRTTVNREPCEAAAAAANHQPPTETSRVQLVLTACSQHREDCGSKMSSIEEN